MSPQYFKSSWYCDQSLDMIYSLPSEGWTCPPNPTSSHLNSRTWKRTLLAPWTCGIPQPFRVTNYYPGSDSLLSTTCSWTLFFIISLCQIWREKGHPNRGSAAPQRTTLKSRCCSGDKGFHNLSAAWSSHSSRSINAPNWQHTVSKCNCFVWTYLGLQIWNTKLLILLFCFSLCMPSLIGPQTNKQKNNFWISSLSFQIYKNRNLKETELNLQMMFYLSVWHSFCCRHSLAGAQTHKSLNLH